MKIRILEKSHARLKFLLEDTDAAFANALRRVMKDEVPVMAVEDVDFEENTSGLFDEVIAHRLGLIPLTFDRKTYNLRDECKCEGKGCSRCTATLVLEKQGPKVVRASDMKSTDEGVRPTDNNIPIVELLEGQKLRFEATAQLGTGSEHVKWQASHVGYSYKPTKFKGDIKELKDTGDAALDDTAFIFDVESVSGLTAAEIVEAALDVLESRTEEFVSDFKKAAK